MPVSLIPQLVLDNYTQVTLGLLARHSIDLLLCDLDYTLAPRSMPEPDETLYNWLEGLQSGGVTVMILSNNRSSRRVETFCKTLGIRYVGHAGKPSPRGYREAMAQAGASPAHTAMLGDKLLTDVLGANRSGVLSVMVEPLGGPVGVWNHFLHLLQRPFKWIGKRRMERYGTV